MGFNPGFQVLIKHHAVKTHRGQNLSSIPNTETAGLAETSVPVCQSTWRHIPEDSNLQILMMNPTADVTEITSVMQQTKAEDGHTQTAHCASAGASCFTSAVIEPSYHRLSGFGPRSLAVGVPLLQLLLCASRNVEPYLIHYYILWSFKVINLCCCLLIKS